MKLAAMVMAGLLAVSTTAHAQMRVETEGDQLETQIKGSLIGFGLGGGTGLLLGFGAAKGKPEAAITLTGLGVLVGTPMGVYYYSRNRQGTGQGWATALGAVAGMAVGITGAVGLIKDKETTQNIITGIGIALACTLAGPIVGYRASRTFEQPEMVSPRLAAERTTTMIPLGTVAF